jgi:hypothetical protein
MANRAKEGNAKCHIKKKKLYNERPWKETTDHGRRYILSVQHCLAWAFSIDQKINVYGMNSFFDLHLCYGKYFLGVSCREIFIASYKPQMN